MLPVRWQCLAAIRVIGLGSTVEEVLILVRHQISMGFQCGQKRGACLSHAGGNGSDALIAYGQAVGLLVALHLQPVLDRAQEDIGIGQPVALHWCQTTTAHQFVEHIQCLHDAQARLLSGEQQLMALGKELELTNAAAVELDVIAMPWVVLMPPLLQVDLALDRFHVLDGGKVAARTPDPLSEGFHQAAGHWRVGNNRTRLNHRGPFPVQRLCVVIGNRTGGGDSERGRCRVGPQAQISPEDIAIDCTLLQQVDQVAGQSGENLWRVVAVYRRGGGIIECNQVHIAGIVQLTRAEFAHGEDNQPAAAFRCRHIRWCVFPGGGELPEQVSGREPDQMICDQAQRQCDVA